MTQTVTIDGPTVERPDSSEVCLGYYLDSEDRVWSRFSLAPGDYEVDDVVVDYEIVESMDDLPPVDDHYLDT